MTQGNKIKGEVSFDTSKGPLTLVYNIDALCTLEDRLDLSVTEIAEKLGGNLRLGFLRAVLWAGLRERHPGIDEKAAGEFIRELGGVAVGALVGEALAAAFAPEAASGSENPPEAAATA